MGMINRKPSGDVLPPLVRTATGQSVRLRETFDTDLVAAGTVAAAVGYGSNISPIWDGTNKRLVIYETAGRARVWAYTATSRNASTIDYQAAVTLIDDTQNLQHYGLWLQCGEQNVGNGIRLAHINSELTLSRFVGGVEYPVTLTSGNRIVGPWPVGSTKILRLQFDFAAKTAIVWVDGVEVSRWSDPELTYTSGRPGGFTYGASVAWDDLDSTVPGPPQVGGLGALLLRPTAGGIYDASLVPSTGQRVDVITSQGAVRASAWLSPGDQWLYQGTQ